jgi:hypothetical protein
MGVPFCQPMLPRRAACGEIKLGALVTGRPLRDNEGALCHWRNDATPFFKVGSTYDGSKCANDFNGGTGDLSLS